MIPEISLDPAMKPITFNEMMHWAMWNVCDHTRLGNPSIAKTPHRFSPCFASPCLPTPYCLPKREKQKHHPIPNPFHPITNPADQRGERIVLRLYSVSACEQTASRIGLRISSMLPSVVKLCCV